MNTVSRSKTVPFQIIQFSISKQFKYKYGLIVKKIDGANKQQIFSLTKVVLAPAIFSYLTTAIPGLKSLTLCYEPVMV